MMYQAGWRPFLSSNDRLFSMQYTTAAHAALRLALWPALTALRSSRIMIHLALYIVYIVSFTISTRLRPLVDPHYPPHPLESSEHTRESGSATINQDIFENNYPLTPAFTSTDSSIPAENPTVRARASTPFRPNARPFSPSSPSIDSSKESLLLSFGRYHISTPFLTFGRKRKASDGSRAGNKLQSRLAADDERTRESTDDSNQVYRVHSRPSEAITGAAGTRSTAVCSTAEQPLRQLGVQPEDSTQLRNVERSIIGNKWHPGNATGTLHQEYSSSFESHLAARRLESPASRPNTNPFIVCTPPMLGDRAHAFPNHPYDHFRSHQPPPALYYPSGLRQPRYPTQFGLRGIRGQPRSSGTTTKPDSASQSVMSPTVGGMQSEAHLLFVGT